MKHFIGATVLAMVLVVSAELGRDSDNDLVAALRRSVQETANSAGQKIVSRQLERQPTVTVRPGASLRIVVQKDLMIDTSGIGESND